MRENFLILNFLDDYLEIAGFKVDFIKKEIFENSVKRLALSNSEVSRPPKSLEKKLKKILRVSFYPKSYKIIFAFNSRQAITQYRNIGFVRENPKKIIDEADLENIISQALWRVFDEGRQSSAKQLGLSDVEILLSDAKIYDFQIDGKSVLNPLKRRGARIDIFLSETFVNRSFFKSLISLLPRRAKFAFGVEAGSAAAHLLSKSSTIYPHGRYSDTLFAKVGPRRTNLFLKWKNRIGFLDDVGWGSDHFHKKFTDDLGVDFSLGPALSHKIIKRELSLNFEKKLDKLIEAAIAELNKIIKTAALKTEIWVVYLNINPLLPERFFHKIIKPIGVGEVLERFGFVLGGSTSPILTSIREEVEPLKIKTNSSILRGRTSSANNVNIWEVRPRGTPDFLTLAALLEYYFLPYDDLLNHLAKRRMRWLIPSV